ncbi:MAG: histidine kinase [Propioniciclava sp.]|uniref:sensor histidine kinase n=1 Tax=Propioniciclava sp. TaxID=2038686 RepID=UPI0039E48546
MQTLLAVAMGIACISLHAVRGAPWHTFLFDAVSFAWVALTPRWAVRSAWILLAAWGVQLALAPVGASLGEYSLLLPILGGVPEGSRRPWAGYSVAVVVLLTALSVHHDGADVLVPAAGLWVFLVFAMWIIAYGFRVVRQVHDNTVRRTVAEDRLELARNLHDTIAHDLSLIVMRTEEAKIRGTTEDDLDYIAHKGREAVSDIRALLHQLRGSTPAIDSTDTAPALTQILTTAQTRLVGGGFSPDIASDDVVADLPANVRTTLAVILHEAISNILRHGDAQLPCSLLVQSDGTRTVVVLTNVARRASASSGGGLGIVGMTERAADSGGVLHSGRDGHLWRTEIALPHHRAQKE